MFKIHPELLAAGQDFINEHSDAADRVHPAMHYIAEVTEGKNFDGSARYNILKVEPHSEDHPSTALLDEPLFSYNPYESNLPALNNHPLVNASDCSPEMLITLGNGIAEERYPVVTDLKKTMLRRIGGTLLSAATPRMLIDDIDPSVGVICKDNQSPDIYMSAAELYFDSVARNHILAFDVHDIVQHSAQLAIPEWSLAARAIASTAVKAWAHPELDETTTSNRFERELSTFIWGVVFEESVLSQDGELYSYGCLNWLTPGDTPVDRIDSIFSLSEDKQRMVHRWHYLDAIKDLYRKQFQAEKEYGQKFNWMEELGYDGNKWFLELCHSPDKLPFVPLNLEDADKLEIITPSSPEELMENATNILSKHSFLG